MNQIPNIEEEKRDMELILEVLPHLILGNAEELYNNPDGEMAKNTISEMQRVIRETHHQQLQKARDEEWEKVHRMVDNILAVSIDYHMDSVVLAKDIENIAKKYFPTKDHSELDLPINSIFKE